MSPTSGNPLIWLMIGGLVVLLVIFVLVSLSFGRRRAQARQSLARFKADELAAQRMAEIEVQRQQQASALGNWGIAYNQQAQFVPDLRCPFCSYPVQPNDAYCPNCRALLSSGLDWHAPQPLRPSHSAAKQASNAPWAGNYPPLPPQRPVQQSSYAQQPSPLVPASAISDQPTIEMSPHKSKDELSESEKSISAWQADLVVNEISNAHPQPVPELLLSELKNDLPMRSSALPISDSPLDDKSSAILSSSSTSEKQQDNLEIKATLQRLWDREGR